MQAQIPYADIAGHNLTVGDSVAYACFEHKKIKLQAGMIVSRTRVGDIPYVEIQSFKTGKCLGRLPSEVSLIEHWRV